MKNYILCALLALYITAPCAAQWREEGGRGRVTLDGAAINSSNPTIAELDKNATNGKEIITATSDGIVHALHADGTVLWSYELPNHSCTATSSTNKLYASPAVGPLLGDGEQYVVAAYGGIGGKSCGGGVVALHGADGTLAWHFDLKKFAKKEKFWSFLYSVYSSPALADTDGDGKLEIGFGSFDRNVYLLNADGTVRWYYTAADTVWSSPTFYDLDGDGILEMIIGTDISKNTKIKPPTRNGGFLYAFKTKARPKKSKKIGFRDPTAYLWKTYFNQVIFAAPAVADLIATNNGPEVIIGSGCYFPEHSNQKTGAWFKVVSGRTGKILRTLPVTACSSSRAAIADLNADGSLDVVVTASGGTDIGGDGIGRVVAWNPEQDLELWSSIPRIRGANNEKLGNFASPVIADLSGQGALSVLVSNGRGINILSGTTGAATSCEESSCDDGRAAYLTSGNLQNTPVVADLNGDGVPEIVASGSASGGSGAGVYRWKLQK